MCARTTNFLLLLISNYRNLAQVLEVKKKKEEKNRRRKKENVRKIPPPRIIRARTEAAFSQTYILKYI